MAENFTKMGSDWCPVCASKLDAATKVGDEHPVPEPGDISFCIKCASMLKYGSDMALEEMTQRDFQKLEYDHKMFLLEFQAKLLTVIEN